MEWDLLFFHNLRNALHKLTVKKTFVLWDEFIFVLFTVIRRILYSDVVDAKRGLLLS
jgi:hypothetical protein